MNDAAPIKAIVLAGERPGGNVLARALGLSSSVLAEVGGKACVARVISVLRECNAVAGGTLVGPTQDVVAAESLFTRLLERDDFSWQEPASGPSSSALLVATAQARYPLLLTAADHALLTAPIVDEFCAQARAIEADFVVGLVPHQAVRDAYPDSKRTLIKFTDGPYCGSNLFLVNRPAGRAALQFWSAMEKERKRPWRLAWRLGLKSLWRYLIVGMSAVEAFALLSERCGANIDFVIVTSPRAAIDVDSLADLELAHTIVGEDHD